MNYEERGERSALCGRRKIYDCYYVQTHTTSNKLCPMGPEVFSIVLNCIISIYRISKL